MKASARSRLNRETTQTCLKEHKDKAELTQRVLWRRLGILQDHFRRMHRVQRVAITCHSYCDDISTGDAKAMVTQTAAPLAQRQQAPAATVFLTPVLWLQARRPVIGADGT